MKVNGRLWAVYATFIVMEGSWLYAFLTLLNTSVTESRLSVWGLLLIYLISFASSKALRYLGWHKAILSLLSWLLWIPVMLLSVKIQLYPGIGLADSTWLSAIPQAFAQILYGFRPELMILLSSAALWWLGRRLAYLGTGFSNVVAEFQFGLFMLLIAFFVGSQLGLDQTFSVATAFIFFACGLIGISIAHAQEGNSWLSRWYQGHWSGLLLVSIALILIIGLLISIIVTPDFLRLIVAGLGWLWGLVEKFLTWLASLFPPPNSEQPLPTIPAIPGGENPEDTKIWQIPDYILTALRWGWTIMVAGLVLFTLWRISSQIFGWMRKRMNSPGAEVESLSGDLKADLLRWLKGVLFKLLGIKVRLRPRRKEYVSPEVASVRQLYTQLLQWAASGGHPRQDSQTPYEYQYVLGDLLPGTQSDLSFVTQQYVGARYGLSSPSEGELQELKQCWQRIKQSKFAT